MNDDQWVMEYPLHDGEWGKSTLMGYNEGGTQRVPSMSLEKLIQRSKLENGASFLGYRIRNTVTGEVILWDTLAAILQP